jgi:hypothetical protein
MAEICLTFALEDQQTAVSVTRAIEQAAPQFRVQHLAFGSPAKPNNNEYSAEYTILLWSKAAASGAQRRMRDLVQAWSSNRLFIVALDDTPLPIGLRDLPAISFRSSRDVIKELLFDIGYRTAASEEERAAREVSATDLKNHVHPLILPGDPLVLPGGLGRTGKRFYRILAPLSVRLYRILAPLFVGTLTAAGLIFALGVLLLTALALMSIIGGHYANAPHQPSSFEILAYWFGYNPILPTLLALSLLLLGALIGGGAVWLFGKRRRRKNSPVLAISAQRSLPVFVSYSRKDTHKVDQLVNQIEQFGLKIWIDRQSTGSQRYAGQVVSAIRASRLVALMSSENALSSDQVIREIYVAGDNKKPFVIFQLDLTEFPDDILYFVSGFPRVSVANLNQQQLHSEIARLVAV